MAALLQAGHGRCGGAAGREDVIHQQQGLELRPGRMQAAEDLPQVSQALAAVEMVLPQAGPLPIQGRQQPVPPLPGEGPGQDMGQISASAATGGDSHNQQGHPQIRQQGEQLPRQALHQPPVGVPLQPQQFLAPGPLVRPKAPPGQGQLPLQTSRIQQQLAAARQAQASPISGPPAAGAAGLQQQVLQKTGDRQWG